MKKTFTKLCSLTAAWMVFGALLLTGVMNAQVYSNTAAISIPSSGASTPYPSTISVSGGPASIDVVTITLNGLNHSFDRDIDILLVAPNGDNLVVLSDVGDFSAIVDANVTISDLGATALSQSAAIVSGTFQPGNAGTLADAFAAPAPTVTGNAAPFGTATMASVFSGDDANGDWKLFVVDDAGGDSGSIDGGWSITFTSANVSGCTDPAACNYNALATVDDGSCSGTPGCDDPAACNYDPAATCNNGSCCYGSCISVVVGGGDYDYEIGWTLYDPLGNIVASGGAPYVGTFCISDPACDYSIDMTDAYGDGWNGGTYTIVDGNGNVTATGTLADGFSGTAAVAVGVLSGCTDPTANNYDAQASCDDGSCVTCAPGETVININMFDTAGDGWNGGSYTITDALGNAILSGSLDGNAVGDGASAGIDSWCLADGCYFITISGSTSAGEIGWSITDAGGNQIVGITAPFSINGAAVGFPWGSASGCAIPGCTNFNCFNFNAYATTDDGSCVCPPANDDCSNAIEVTCGSSENGTLVLANSDPEATSCSSINVSTAGVWYVYAGTGDQVTASLCSGTWDSRLHVYTGSCGALECVAANDDYCGLTSSVSFNTVIGQDYYILVSRYASFVTIGDFTLDITCTSCGGAPANDVSCDSYLLDSGVAQTGSLCCAGADDISDYDSYATGYGVWYSYSNADAVGFNLDLVNGNDGGTNLNADLGYIIYSGECGNLTYVTDCNSSSGCALSFLTADGFDPLSTYYILVYTTDPASCGDYSISLTAQIEGCTDNTAVNYDPAATIDNGSCQYIEPLNADFTADQTEVCAGTTVNLTNLSTSTLSFTSSWEVTGPESFTSSDNNFSVTLTIPGTYSVSLFIDNGQSTAGQSFTDYITVFETGVYYADADGDGFGNNAVSLEACVPPSGYVADNTDCDDDNASVNPDATEVCNNIDDNCDTQIDEGVLVTLFPDDDGDGYGNADLSMEGCAGTAGYVTNGEDCDDTDAARYPGAEEVCNNIDDNCDTQIDEGVQIEVYLDGDGDGFGDSGTLMMACSVEAGYAAEGGDCDDGDPSINPSAIEVCNNIDDNCDTQIDENLSATYFADSDGDGYGDDAVTVENCSAPVGFVSVGGDCDDTDPARYPGAEEVCNNIDDNCDTQIDENLSSTYYADADGDGYGDDATAVVTCSPESGYVSEGGDCDDGNDTVYPGATEICDNLDNNCNNEIDENLSATYYADADGDGFGDDATATVTCSPATGYVTTGGDCDDTDSAVYPGATEVCNGIDDNCVDGIDEGLLVTYYADADGDGYGNAAISVIACSAPSGYVTNSTDCNDANAAIRPGAFEACDGVDNDCDGDFDEGCFGPPPSNDQYAGATIITATAYNVTSPLYGNLYNATPSPEFNGTVPVGAGQDAWYKFTSTSEAVRIRVYSATSDISIQLQDSQGNVVDNESVVTGSGTEILNIGGLTPGEWYYVAVRNMSGVGGVFVINVRRYDPSVLTTSVAQTLCGNARCQYTNANSYTFHFDGQGSGNSYTRTVNNTTNTLLSAVSGLLGNDTYDVTVDAIFTPTNGAGTTEVITVEGVTTLPLVVNGNAPMSLRTTDVCPAVKTLNALILAQPFACGAVNFQWEFTRTAPSASLPVTFFRGSSSRFLRLNTVPGIESGASYNVRVRPVYANGSFGVWGPVNCVSTVGAAPGLEGFEGDAQEVAAEVSENEFGNQMLIFPNPTRSNEVQLLSDISLSDCNVMITDLTGRQVASWRGMQVNAGIQVFRPETELRAGVYMLRIQSAEGSTSKRFIVE